MVHRISRGKRSSVLIEDSYQELPPSLLEDYSEDAVSKTDVTGLFFNCLPDKVLAVETNDDKTMTNT